MVIHMALPARVIMAASVSTRRCWDITYSKSPNIIILPPPVPALLLSNRLRQALSVRRSPPGPLRPRSPSTATRFSDNDPNSTVTLFDLPVDQAIKGRPVRTRIDNGLQRYGHLIAGGDSDIDFRRHAGGKAPAGRGRDTSTGKRRPRPEAAAETDTMVPSSAGRSAKGKTTSTG